VGGQGTQARITDEFLEVSQVRSTEHDFWNARSVEFKLTTRNAASWLPMLVALVNIGGTVRRRKPAELRAVFRRENMPKFPINTFGKRPQKTR